MTLKLLSMAEVFDGVLELDRSIPRPIVLPPLVGVVFLIGDTDDPLALFGAEVLDFNAGVALLAACALITIYAASVGVKTVFVKYCLTISISWVFKNFKT